VSPHSRRVEDAALLRRGPLTASDRPLRYVGSSVSFPPKLADEPSNPPVKREVYYPYDRPHYRGRGCMHFYIYPSDEQERTRAENEGNNAREECQRALRWRVCFRISKKGGRDCESQQR
jgi:hypothetical protein